MKLMSSQGGNNDFCKERAVNDLVIKNINNSPSTNVKCAKCTSK